MIIVGKFIKWLFLGAIIGGCVAIGLYILGFGIELLNCACAIVTCDCESSDAIPAMWSGAAFVSVLKYCTIAGTAVGGIYGIVTGIQDKKARRNAQLQLNHEDVTKELDSLTTSCDKVASQLNGVITGITFVAPKEKTESDKVVSECNAAIERVTKAATPRSK